MRVITRAARSHIVLVLVLALDLLGAAIAHAADENWSEFRGPTSDGHAQCSSLPTTWSETENVKWKTAIHGRGWSSPVIWGDQIWLTTATPDGKQQFAVCVDKNTGKILHDILLFENEKPAFCHATNSYASCTPVLEEGRVYIHFGAYGTACLDTKTGKTLWSRRDLPCDHYRGPGSSPIIYGKLLIVHYDGFDLQYVVAFDKETGKTAWKIDRAIDYQTTDGDVKKAFSTPIVIEVNGQQQLISTTSKAVLGYDPLTGKELWRVRYNEFSATARPLFAKGVLFINTGFGKAQLWAMKADGQGDVTETHVKWKQPKSIGSKPSQVLVGDLIYNVSDQGVATAIEAESGKEIWSQRLGGGFSASLLYGDGKIFFAGEDGNTTVVEPGREYKQLGQNKLDDGCMASPAASGKALYLRTTKHLYRIEN